MEKVTLNVEFILMLHSKQEWINKVPECLPRKKKKAEEWVWIDSNGNSMALGEDFSAAEEMSSYPVRVYRKIRAVEVCKQAKEAEMPQRKFFPMHPPETQEPLSDCNHDRYCDQQTKDQKCKQKSGCNFKF